MANQVQLRILYATGKEESVFVCKDEHVSECYHRLDEISRVNTQRVYLILRGQRLDPDVSWAEILGNAQTNASTLVVHAQVIDDAPSEVSHSRAPAREFSERLGVLAVLAAVLGVLGWLTASFAPLLHTSHLVMLAFLSITFVAVAINCLRTQ